jgi:hypothetical protein
MVHNGSSQGASTLPHDPHEEFQKLCALSTTGELTSEEWMRLAKHLVHRRDCKNLKLQYECVIASTLPALAAEARTETIEEGNPYSWSMDEAEQFLTKSLRGETAAGNVDLLAVPRLSRPLQIRRYAIAASVLAAYRLGSYQVGILRERGSNVIAAAQNPAKIRCCLPTSALNQTTRKAASRGLPIGVV